MLYYNLPADIVSINIAVSGDSQEYWDDGNQLFEAMRMAEYFITLVRVPVSNGHPPTHRCHYSL